VGSAYLAVDELEIPRALGITVTCTILGAGLVARVLLQTTICVHRHEVQSAIETTWQVREIDVECELLAASEFEHLVLSIRRHEICARADVRRVRSLCDELQL
jgi:hypothetical protein